MANARQILDSKTDGDRQVATITPDHTVLDAAKLMNDRHIGSVVVIADGRLVGIFTERDVMRRVVAAGLPPETTRVADVMTTPVACASPATTRGELGTVMREKRIRHVPVVEHDQVIGMISIGDLNRAENSEQGLTIEYLQQYISVA